MNAVMGRVFGRCASAERAVIEIQPYRAAELQRDDIMLYFIRMN
jgi:hypothetical protein